MAVITARCPRLEVARWVGDWAGGLALEPPVALALDITVGDPPADLDDRPPWHQPDLELRAGPPLGDVRVRWLRAPALGVVPAAGTTARVVLSEAALAERDLCARSFLTAVVVVLLRRGGWHHVHAATAVDPRGRAWLIAGDSGAGKSTTAALLATRGWRVGGDDLSFLTGSGDGVHAVAARAPIRLRPGGLQLLGRAADRAAERKPGFFPEELGGAWVQRIRPDVIALPILGDGPTTAVPLPPRDVLSELVRWSAWVALEPDLAQSHLDLLARLAGQASGYRVMLGTDLFRPGDRLMELVP